ncbi:MAG: hypothetical protein Q8R92_15405 [Deltaproteobacteria bacterium]|nr:hypothetical protein [Deltaproteobacteria bacterium]
MASDWYFSSPSARAFVETLEPELRAEWKDVMKELLRDPEPDDEQRVTLGPPFPAGLIGTWTGSFWIAYRLINREVVEVANVYWSPESPRYRGPQPGLFL